MKIVAVRFKGTEKIYAYKTNLDLIEGAIYDIVADDRTTYDNPIKVIDPDWRGSVPPNLRTITNATLIQAPRRPKGGVEKIFTNAIKKTTVIIWEDGTKTKVKCQEGEEFDFEKGIAMCFMKKAFDNRGCFNEVFKMMRKSLEEGKVVEMGELNE